MHFYWNIATLLCLLVWLHSCYNGRLERLWRRLYNSQSLKDLQKTFARLSSTILLSSQPVHETLHGWLTHWPKTVLESLSFILQNREGQKVHFGCLCFLREYSRNLIPWLLKLIMLMSLRMECLYTSLSILSVDRATLICLAFDLKWREREAVGSVLSVTIRTFKQRKTH